MDDTSRSFTLLLASSLAEGVITTIMVLGSSEEGVLSDLVEGLQGSFGFDDVAPRCAELRATLPRIEGVWARRVEWQGGSMVVFSTRGRESGTRGGARATLSGRLPSTAVYEVTTVVELATPELALRTLESELFRVEHNLRLGQPVADGPGVTTRPLIAAKRNYSVRTVSIAL